MYNTNGFNITLVKQSRKVDPKTGRKKRTRQVLSRDKGEPIFNVKIKRGNETMTNNNNFNETKKSNPFEFKVKIHRGDEVTEAVADNVNETMGNEVKFNTRVIKESDDMTVKTVGIGQFIANVPDTPSIISEEPEVEPELEEESIEEEVIEEPVEEEELPEESIEEESLEVIEEEPEEEPESLGEIVDDIVEDIFGEDKETPSRDSEIISEGDEEECVETDEDDIGRVRSIGEDEEFVMVNGEMMNAVELEEDSEYEEEDDFDDLIPSKFKKDFPAKKGKKKQSKE